MFSQVKDLAVYLFPLEMEMETAVDAFFFFTSFPCFWIWSRCDERVVRIQKMDVLEGIFICGAPSCLRSFLARPDFEWHVADSHGPLLHPEPDQTFPFQSPVPSNPPLTPIPQAKVLVIFSSPIHFLII
jgi:hypothetical protein